MTRYALIKSKIVENVVEWDGEGNIFADYDDTYEIPEGVIIGPGYTVSGKKGSYSFREPVFERAPEEIAAENLTNADSEYARSSNMIDALNEQIADEDYTDTSEEAVKTSLTTWTGYRKSLRAYIKAADGSKALPLGPDSASK